MCTRVLWPDANGSVLTGRNMDFRFDLQTNLWALPRGVKRDDGVAGELSWSAKYGSVVATAMDIFSADGINEAGLSGHILWLAESNYGARDESRPVLSQAVWLQYILDNFATVAEAVDWMNQTQVQIAPMVDPTSGVEPALHLALDDATGDSAIIEYIDGKLNAHHDRSYTVMTNSPPFDQQLELLKGYEGFGGDKPIPGSTVASDRFVRAAHYAARLPEPSTQLQGIAAILSVMRNAAQPFRTPDEGKPDASQTIWQVVADLTNKRYVYESTTRPNIVWVDLTDLDLREGAPQLKLDLQSKLALQGGIAGNVSSQFADSGPLNLLTIPVMNELLAAAKKKS
ncbi:linear amide C-N hydrolase [Mycolicibacterium brumae]|uniref:Linear amide C-N hydrolase n=1 Tax=Mycolicibacterium brumae TaxID=85968 RepID=A0A2G5PBW8_9MYCO|nr:linear amide C-N hydrolase [Mycolicibacterium brumae]MCV7193069.1 linear amide C-N hydrolase [Mycolicibacterium brumae]PIB75384.1 linear amide C-N hydrolase [Mycolicibacterium brumae]RWA22007.1 hypothetical protein MBRU_13555 [Mycolicibacterium brumae DSM 44177]UWW07929.1 linear amide C-N hydrolase [Mycolicibacterium brumae]